MMPIGGKRLLPYRPQKERCSQPASGLGKAALSCRPLATEVVALRLSSARNAALVKVDDKPRIIVDKHEPLDAPFTR